MSKSEAIAMLFIGCGGLFMTTIGFAIAWIRARDRELHTRLTLLSQGQQAPASTAQLERAIEAIAIEVERISEGQRFTTRLLAERDRGDARNAPAPLRPVITPH